MNYQLSFCTADRISNRVLFEKIKSQISKERLLARASCFFRNASARFQAPEFDCEIILSDWRKHLLDGSNNKKKSTGHLGQKSPAVEAQFLWIVELFSQVLFGCRWRMNVKNCQFSFAVALFQVEKRRTWPITAAGLEDFIAAGGIVLADDSTLGRVVKFGYRECTIATPRECGRVMEGLPS